MKKESKFEPKIVTFICTRSSHAMQKRRELKFPDNVKVIRIICLGRINPSFIFKTFERGADGVLLIGCPIDECQYSFGSKLAEEHLFTTKKIGNLLGIDKARLKLVNISLTKDLKFKSKVNKFFRDVKKLGPSPLSNR
ncbi:MAG: hydrogenase iron-sulfur subunit [Candidatus Cloacimonetes bacterium]|nr:hydrogenase iron-sulfur subunit [Candidatus Cloacimonadota bacterium]